MLMPGRNSNPDKYRFGMNGMEKDNEVSGTGNSYTTFFRSYDPRIGRWRSIDPVTHSWQTPYNAFDNNPAYWSDPGGADANPGEYVRNSDGTETKISSKGDEDGIDYVYSGGEWDESGTAYVGGTTELRDNRMVEMERTDGQLNLQLNNNWSPPKDGREFMPDLFKWAGSDKANKYFNSAGDHFMKIFDGEFSASAKVAGGGIEGQVGPVKAKLSGDVISIKGKINSEKVEISATGASGGMSLKFASAEAAYSVTVADIKIGYDYEDGIYSSGTPVSHAPVLKLSKDNNGIEFSAANSTKGGITVNVSVIKAGGSVNFGEIAMTISDILMGIMIYVEDHAEQIIELDTN